MILYHATYGKFIEVIRDEGLLSRIDGNKSDNWGWGTEFTDEVFLADDEDVAASYCESSDIVDDETYNTGIFIVCVDADDNNVEPDPWANSESSYVHHGPIYPDRFLSIVPYDDVAKTYAEKLGI